MAYPTDEMIDAGAKALREFEQAGKRLNPWPLVPKAQKRKWYEKVEVVLRATLEAGTE